MNMGITWLTWGVFLLVCRGTLTGRSQPIFMNQFAVHVPDGKDHADEVAERHGFTNLGQIGTLKGYYLLEHKRIRKRSLSLCDDSHQRLTSEPKVKWFQQQQERRRLKRDTFGDFGGFTGFSDFGTFGQGRNQYRGYPSNFPDPLFKEEWYLNGGAKDGFDMNVAPAWGKGYTGKGVVVSILDDGIQTNHPDLAQNYDADASTDINDNDSDPMPRDNGDNKHGTRCAGEVAAVAFNNFCGVGVAYNASIGGVRMLDGSVNDAVEARALSLNPEHIAIYSASWGPEDDGKTVDGPGPLARRAFINGVTTGRGGKGSIFVWASGNGGRHTDSCNCDGYTNSIFTLSISSATQGGYKPWYLEECSSTLATTYSSGTPGHDKSIATVDMDGKLRPDHICTVEHTGTSASAPLASGLVALALEANPELSWRDIQHIVVMTSNPSPLMREGGWITNGVNRKVSHKFGYGLMDGGAMVNLAERWTTVPPQHICKSQEVIEERSIDPSFGSVLTVAVDASGCDATVNEVRFVEHVQCKISLRFFPRGNLRLVLTSPQGTSSTLLMERPRDALSSNFDDWPFLSVHYWGENPMGRWTLQVLNAGNRHVNQPGVLRKWQLIFYGTAVNPVNLRQRGSFSPSSSFIFPSAAPASFFPTSPSQDIFTQSPFRNLPNIFAASGSEKQQVVVSPDQPMPGKEAIDDQQNELGDSVRCHESCATCAGPSQDSCLTCSEGHVHVTDLGLCLQHCPDGYYEDRKTRSCVGCHGNCASCPDGPNICASCDHHLILYNNTCLTSCPRNTYETDDERCESCHPSCETCHNERSDGCVSCPDGKNPSNGQCGGESCPENCDWCLNLTTCTHCYTGFELNSANQCVKSNTSCRPGEVLGSEGCEACTDIMNCTRCPGGLYLFNFTCVTTCGDGRYSDSSWCKPCWPHCEQCSGDREDQCLSCKDKYKLFGGSCLSRCPPTTFSTSWGCSKCHHFCYSCSDEGPFSCTSCAPGRYMDAATKLCMQCQPCNSTNHHQCCHCDPITGKCHLPTGKRRITSEQAAREHEDELVAQASIQSNAIQYGQFTDITVMAIAACSSVIVLFAVIFFILQVRSGVSQRNGYTKLPINETRFASNGVYPHSSRTDFVTVNDENDYADEVNPVT